MTGVQTCALPIWWRPRLLQRVGAEMRAFGGELNALRVSPNLATADADLDRVLDAAAADAV